MSDFKSKLPDFKELGSMTSKLFKDIRNSVSEIITEYKQKHPPEPEKPEGSTTSEAAVEAKETGSVKKAELKPEKKKAAAEAKKPEEKEAAVVEEEITPASDPLEVSPGAPVDDVVDPGDKGA